jgi:hypothetical protein
MGCLILGFLLNSWLYFSFWTVQAFYLAMGFQTVIGVLSGKFLLKRDLFVIKEKKKKRSK